MMWLHAPLAIVQGVYAKYYGLSLTTIAAVILFARFFDAITDPLIGYYSDQHRHRMGTRKPFVLAGGLLMLVSGYFLYVPFSTSVLYFITWIFLFYLAYTLFDIPHNAWASELAYTAADKSKIYSFRGTAIFIGSALFYLIPLLPFFETRDITPATLQVSIIVASVLMLIFLAVCMKYTPNGIAINAIDSDTRPKKTVSWSLMARSIIGNKPLRIFFYGYIFYGLGVGMWYGLIFLYVDSYLGLGQLFAQVFLIATCIGIFATPLWCRLAINFGNKVAMIFAFLLIITSCIYTCLLNPGEAGLQQLLILIIIFTLGTPCIIALAPAMLSMIVDYSAWKFQSENTATYFALFSFLTKASIAVGGAMGLAVAGWYGFDATISTQSVEAGFGLLLAMTVLPVTFLVLALIFTAVNPISTRRHGIIRRCLDARIVRKNSTIKLDMA